MAIPEDIDLIALLVYGGGKSPERIERFKRTTGGKGGKVEVVFIREFMANIRAGIRHRKVAKAAIPEGLPLLRTLQFAAEFWEK